MRQDYKLSLHEIANQLRIAKGSIEDVTMVLHAKHEELLAVLLNVRALTDTSTNQHMLDAVAQISALISHIDQSKELGVTSSLSIEAYLASIGVGE